MTVTPSTAWRSLPPISRQRFVALLAGTPLSATSNAIYDALGDLSTLGLLILWREQGRGGANAFAESCHNPWLLRRWDPKYDTRPVKTHPRDGDFLSFKTYASAAEDLATRLTDPSYKPSDPGVYARTVSLLDLNRAYAPAGDGANDPVARTNAMVIDANNLIGDAPMPTTPTVYDLRTDAHAARFGLTPAERTYLLGQCFKGRNGATPKFVVLHIQDGITTGSLDWWVHGPGVQASASVMANKDGSLLKVIPETDGPWTNGDVNNPTPQSAGLRALGGNPNIWCLTIEAEGRPFDAMPQAEIDAIVWQVRDWMSRYTIPTANILPHRSINSVTRANCPGSYYEHVMRALADPVPTDDSGLVFPVGMDLDLAKRWFGEIIDAGTPYAFNPKGPVSLAWLANGKLTGQWPRLTSLDVIEDGPGKRRRFFRFSNGLVLADSTGQPVRILKAA